MKPKNEKEKVYINTYNLLIDTARIFSIQREMVSHPKRSAPTR
jgi:hypothetical protein